MNAPNDKFHVAIIANSNAVSTFTAASLKTAKTVAARVVAKRKAAGLPTDRAYAKETVGFTAGIKGRKHRVLGPEITLDVNL